MKICRICGVSNADDATRCCVCGTILPEQTIAENRSGQTVPETKKCSLCGKINNKTAVRCSACGTFLGPAGREQTSASVPADKLALIVSTGETLQITTETIIGRAYQPQLWDVYTPRAAFRVSRAGEEYELENLKTNQRMQLRFNTPYPLGRKTFVIKKG
jgi:hypothetical protein